MACIITNLPEFKQLEKSFPDSNMAYMHALNWQKRNNSDSIPTYEQVQEMEKEVKKEKNKVKDDFIEATKLNLAANDLTVTLSDGVYLTTQNESIDTLQARIEDKKALINNFLVFNNLPTDFISYTQIGDKTRVNFNRNKLKNVNRISKESKFDYSRTKKVLDHLAKMFPNVNYVVLNYFQAKKIYDELPQELKPANQDFTEVKSFFNPLTGQAVLIEGAVTDNIAAEEMLHPFVAALKEQNKELYDSLVEEIKTLYPNLYSETLSAYMKNEQIEEMEQEQIDEYINEEILTKGLSDYFNKNFDVKPSGKSKSLIKRFLDFIGNIVSDMYFRYTGKTLSLKDINADSKVTDVINLLNTSDLTFSFSIPEKMKVKFALTDNKEKIIQDALKNATAEQAQVINGLFRNVRGDLLKIYDQFTVGEIVDSGINTSSDFVTLVEGTDPVTGEKIRKYVNPLNPSIEYTSVTSSFNSFKVDDEADFQFNLDMGNIFDMVLEYMVLNKTYEEALALLKADPKINLDILNTDETNIDSEVKKIYEQLSIVLDSISSDNDILLPQVVVHNTSTDPNYPNIAGTIDLLLIRPDGKFQVIDLKTSRHSTKKGTGKLDMYYEKRDIRGTLLNEQSKRFNDEVSEINTAQKHALQVAMYARMLENMGMEMSLENPFYTINFKIDVEGQRKEQKYKGKFKYEGKKAVGVNFRNVSANAHPTSTSIIYSSYLVQDKVPAQDKNKVEEMPENDQDSVLIKDNLNELETIKSSLKKYREILVNRSEAVSEDQNKIFYGEKTAKEYIKKIDKIMLLISQTLTSESITEAKKAYTDVLTSAIRDAESFIKYLQDPQNENDLSYLKYISNAQRFARQFESLYMLKDSDFLKGSNIQNLIFNLQSKLNTLVKNEGNDLSLANQALFNYVRNVTYETTSQNLTMEEVEEMMLESLDISGLEYWTRDLATSRDIHLRVMDKILKNKKMMIIESSKARENKIREVSANLMRVTGIKDPEKLYDFMLNEDGTYIQELSKEYFLLRNEILADQYDSDGNWKQYIQIQNASDATKEQIEYNKKLYEIKQRRREFEQAEVIGDDGTVNKGKYHEYTEEFINARKQYEELVYFSKRGFYSWVRKDGISDREWSLYLDKYYNQVEYVTMRFDSATGVTGETVTKSRPFVKSQFKKVREVSSDGVELFDTRYKELMNPTDELGRAQKEFYETFVGFYEELLKKLPKGEYYKMLGRIPLVRNRFVTDLGKKSNGVIRIFAKLLDTFKSLKEFFTSSSQFRAIATDEFGNLIDSVPIFYTGRVKDEQELNEIYNEIEALNKLRKNDEIGYDNYKKQISILNGRRDSIEKRPSSKEISRDLGTSLLKFSLMAENYEKMSEAEDIFNAFLSVIENKTYQPNGVFELGYYEGKEFKKKGQKLGQQSNVYQRARKYMDMVLYEKDKVTKGKTDKIVNALIKYTSLSYVSMNPFGSMNNYLFAKISNYIEAVGERFFSRKSYLWAEREYKKQALDKLVERTSYIKGEKKNSFYDPNTPLNKWEAFVDYFKMMDSDADLREASFEFGQQSFFGKAINKAYFLQDYGEYNNQTKVGMAILNDVIIRDEEGKMPEISLYDAYVFDPGKSKDSTTFGLRLKDGYENLVVVKAPEQLMVEKSEKGGNINLEELLYNNDFRYNLRNYIRESNKQIHGNYADVDRMVIQEGNFGKLVAQFHKWVMPALNARFQKEYYDENLGHMEGRYRSALRVFEHAGILISGVRNGFKNTKKEYIEAQLDAKDRGKTDRKIQELEKKYTNQYAGFQRTIREAVIILSLFAIKGLMDSLADDDEEEREPGETVQVDLFREPEKEATKFQKRLFNWGRWQTDRLAKDFSIYLPIVPSSWQQALKMIDSPFASTRTLGELGEALSYTLTTAAGYSYYSEEEFYADKDFVYQRGPRKGQLKIAKNWGDVIPLWYSIQKWVNFDNLTNFYIK